MDCKQMLSHQYWNLMKLLTLNIVCILNICLKFLNKHWSVCGPS